MKRKVIIIVEIAIIVTMLIITIGCSKDSNSAIVEESSDKSKKYSLLEVLENNYFYNCIDNICQLESENYKEHFTWTVDLEKNMLYFEITNIINNENEYLKDITEYNYKTKMGKIDYKYRSSELIIATGKRYIKEADEQIIINNKEFQCVNKGKCFTNSYYTRLIIEGFENILRQYNIEV